MDQEIDAPHGLEYICIWIKIQYNTRFPKHFGARLLLKAAADEDHKSHTMYSQSKPYTIFLILKTCWRCKFWPTKRVGFLCMVFQLILYWNTFCIWTISLRCSTSISDTFFFCNEDYHNLGTYTFKHSLGLDEGFKPQHIPQWILQEGMGSTWK